MSRTIIILTKESEIMAFGSLTKACREMGWSYNTQSRKKPPFENDGWKVHRLQLK